MTLDHDRRRENGMPSANCKLAAIPWPETARSTASVRVMRPALRRPRILVAEDDVICRLGVEAMLERFDVEIVFAENGAEAVDQFQAGAFDLVIMDIEMPVMDGLTAIQAIRALERFRGARPTKIVICTGSFLSDVMAATTSDGIFAYLAKPVALGGLDEIMGRLSAAA
jgi:CheY-like chemotaxis protein